MTRRQLRTEFAVERPMAYCVRTRCGDFCVAWRIFRAARFTRAAAMTAVIFLVAAPAGWAAGLYRCSAVDGRMSYSAQPCRGVPVHRIAIDRAEIEIAPSREGEQMGERQAHHPRDRSPARPRHAFSPGSIVGGVDRAPPRTPAYPAAPLGAEVPGMRGPLTGSPSGPTDRSPLPRPAPVADSSTGHPLAPAGDAVIDPLTGTIWLRSGASYVDPATGRIIPGH